MELGQVVQLEHILERVPIGVAILDPGNFNIRYVNAYLRSFLDEPWSNQDISGRALTEIAALEVSSLALPLLKQVASTGERLEYAEVPYEGFLETRGRTHWHITIELSPASLSSGRKGGRAVYSSQPSLLVTLEDVTNTVRSRLHLNAIHHISSAIASASAASALPQVLDRILQALQELVGANRCAVLLTDKSAPTPDGRTQLEEHPQLPLFASVAAQQGIHPCSQDWHPVITDRLLLGRAIQERQTLIITDTSVMPDIDLPYLDDEGNPYRPGSVLCVPIFEPAPEEKETVGDLRDGTLLTRAVIGTIEVYHRRARGFPAEEVKLLEEFALQAGLAIQNARLFRSIDRLARTANRHAHQQENVLQAMPDGVVIYDARWRVASVNHAARRIFGWQEDVIGLPVAEAVARSSAQWQDDLFDPAITPDLAAELERRVMKERIDEIKLIGPDDSLSTLRCAYAPIRDELGDLFAFIVSYHDVTRETAARERIEAEVIARTAELAQRNQALQQAKAALEMTGARLELVLERLPSGVLLVSAEERTISMINYRAVQILQSIGVPLEPRYDPEEAARRAVGHNYEELLRPLDVYSPSGSRIPYEQRPLYRALVDGEASEAEQQVKMVDGQALYLLANSAPLRTADGNITSAVLVLNDITKMKELERTREDFFTTMAHELKTPLANIRAHLSALLAEDLHWSSEDRRNFLQTADDQVERLVGMINHFLDASRVEAGALRLGLEPILLHEMFEDLEERLQALIASSGIRLQITALPTLPAIVGDYELIMSVLTNLLSNAFRYAPEGDIVRLEAAQVPTGVTLSVIDHGIGMTQEQQSMLFTRFSTFAALRRPAVDQPGQPDATRQRRSGRWSPATGLGLYISRGIIEAHGSSLSVLSASGQGAHFSFTLPAFEISKEKG